MPHDPQRNRLKLFGSLIVLAIVMIIATIAQFTGSTSRYGRSSSSEQGAASRCLRRYSADYACRVT